MFLYQQFTNSLIYSCSEEKYLQHFQFYEFEFFSFLNIFSVYSYA